MYDENFDGVFRFTNATDEDFIALWNNKEYNFPKGTCCPMIIPGEPLENIQEIRKRFAYRLAVREFYKSKEYGRLSKMGKGHPPLYDEKVLQPWIDECLKPLPAARATVKTLPHSNTKLKVTKAISEKANLNYEFREDSEEGNLKVLGEMPDTVPNL